MIFLLLEGLGQGTVSSPPLFNIYTGEVLTLKLENRYSIKEHKLKVGRLAFADDFIVYISGRDPEMICRALEGIVNEINKHYLLWNLKINPSKCETIIFHKPLRYLTQSTRDKIKNFEITINIDNIQHLVPHK